MAEIENPNENDDEELQSKNDDNVDVQGNLSHDLPDWLQEFKHGMVDESVPEHPDTSSFLRREQKWYRVSTTFYSLPEGPELRYLFDDENCKGFLQETHQYSRAQSGNFW